MNKKILALALSLALVSPAYAATCDDAAPADPGVSCGDNAHAGDRSNVAIGNDVQLVPVVVNGTTVQPANATAVGAFAQAAPDATAFGAFARALGGNAAALGRSAIAGTEAAALGANAEANVTGGVAIGYLTKVTGNYGIALGRAARSDGGIAIGWDASTTNNGSAAFGTFARSAGFGAQAFGTQSVADAAYAASFGHGAQARADGALALGALAEARGAGSVALGSNSVAEEFGVVSFGRAGATRRLVNLSAGVADTDGVNVAQLKALAPALGGGSTIINGVFVNPIYNLAGGTFNNVGDALTYLDNRVTNIALTPGPSGPQGPQGPTGPQGPQGPGGGDTGGGDGCGEAVCYDDASRRTVTVNKGGSSTRITNVSAGVSNTDAVNVSQLDAGVTRAVSTSNAYTDQRISELRGDVWRVDRNARGGIASALAVAGLPQAYAPGARMAAVAASGYRGEAGLAVGVSGVSDSGRWVYKLAGSSNTAGDFGMSVGAGVQW